ncbi:MAG: hypothetical protein Q4G68_06105 [Planctomycetia bacterium]|nr:hypothetical protein [Planctomycetia bacterium]
MHVILCLAVLTAAITTCYAQIIAEPSACPSGRFNQFVERMEQSNVDLFMVGDSITHRWEPYPTFPELCGLEVWNEFYATARSRTLCSFLPVTVFSMPTGP